MRILLRCSMLLFSMLLVSTLLVSAVACGGDETPTGEAGCGYDSYAQILSGADADRVVPTGQEGALTDVLVGTWQHTWAYDPGLPGAAWTAISDADTNIRFAIRDLQTFLYCQRAGANGVRESALTLDGTKLKISGPGYTAKAWTKDIMVWRNDLFQDREALYVLRRLK